MKTAVITLAVIGVLATLGVLFVAVAFLYSRKRDARAARLLELAQMTAIIERAGLRLDGFDFQFEKVRQAIRARFGAVPEDVTLHFVAFGEALTHLASASTETLTDHILAIHARVKTAQTPEADVFWTAALLAVSAEGLKREMQHPLEKQRANEILIRSLFVIWPEAALVSKEYHDAIATRGT